MPFWEDLHCWLNPKSENFSGLTKENINFGMLSQNGTDNLPMNTLITQGKFFLHKNMKTWQNLYVFHKELCNYFLSLKLMEKKNALQLYELVEKPGLSENL